MADIVGFCESKMLAGDGTFAIAYAIMELVIVQKQTAAALDRLGFNDGRQAGPPGTTEAIAMELKRIADAMERQSN